jgi:putative ABC transport system permease protein
VTGLLIRLSFAGLSNRKLPALMLACLIVASAATMTLGFQLRRVADEPWQRTFQQTHGAHVVLVGSAEDADKLIAAPGVTESTGPLAAVVTTRGEYGMRVVGVGATPSAVERPAVTDGRWLRGDDEIVLERSYAEATGVRPGDTVPVATTEGTIRLTVAGLAVVASGEPYPESQPGLAFATGATVARIQPDPARRDTLVGVRLADPRTAGVVAALLDEPGRQGPGIETWLQRRADADDRNRVTSIVLTTYAALVLVAVGLMIATFVGARVLARRRELALLKAAGFTPRQLMLLALIENLAIALAAAGVGVVAGAAVAPRIVKDTAALTGTVPVTVDAVTVAGVVVAILAAVSLATMLPARRTVRAATIDALTAPAVRSQLAVPRLGDGVALRLGLRQTLARPGRAAAVVLALALGVGALTSALAMEATLTKEDAVENATRATFPPPGDPAGLGPSHADPVVVPDLGREQVRPIVWGLNVLLLLVIVANVLATTVLGVRERTRENGVLRALGLTPRELSGSIVGSQVVLAALAAGLGIPFGIGLFVGVYRLASGAVDPVLPPAWQVVGVAVATVAAIALVSLPPARAAGRLAVVEALRRE